MKLVRRECGLHEFDAFNVWVAEHVVKVGWILMGADLLMDLERCSTVKFPSVEYVGGGNCSEALKNFGNCSERLNRNIQNKLAKTSQYCK